jgi:hypothetical protein
LLGVEASVDRVDQNERVIRAEAAAAGLLGEDRELLAALDEARQLAEDDRFGGAVDLDGRVAAGADAQGRAACLGARERQHGATHAVTDAGEDVEPVDRFQ